MRGDARAHGSGAKDSHFADSLHQEASIRIGSDGMKCNDMKSEEESRSLLAEEDMRFAAGLADCQW
jgi:hypothetical protein